MEKIKKIVASPNMLLFFLVVKVVTYYYLIDVNILFHPLLIGTVGVFWIFFTHLSESKWKKKELVFLLIYGFYQVVKSVLQQMTLLKILAYSAFKQLRILPLTGMIA